MALEIAEREIIDRLIRKGVEYTTRRLEKLSQSKWGIMSSSIREVEPVRLLQVFRKGEDDCVGTYFHASSLVPLEFLIMFSTEGANALTKAVIEPCAERLKSRADLITLTVGEVANFLAQGVLTVIGDEFNVMLILNTPDVLVGRKVELLARAFSRYDGREDMLLISQVDIYSNSLSAGCNFVIIVNSEMFHKLLKTAGST